MSDVYRKFDFIAKKLNVKHHCSKYDMMENFLIPFYFRAIRVQHSGTKFYPTLATDPLTSVIRTSEFENPTTKFKMLPVDDIVLFATHMVCKQPETDHESFAKHQLNGHILFVPVSDQGGHHTP